MNVDHAILAAIAAVLVVGAMYAASCAWWPLAKCWRCEGSGKRARRDGKVWRSCRWCRGTGRRLRVGRWAWNRVSRLRKQAE